MTLKTIPMLKAFWRVMVYTVALNVGISIEVDSHIRQKSWLKTVSSCPKAMPIQRKVYKSQ